MTDPPKRAELCQRCGRRAAAEDLVAVDDPSATLHLCDSCFAAEFHERLDTAMVQLGHELEAALREEGSPLREGITGEAFLRSMLQETAREMDTPEFRARAAPLLVFARALAAELPDGTQDPEFATRLMEQMRALRDGNERPGAEPSA